MRLIDTSIIQPGFRITIKKRVRSKMDPIKTGDIIGFYEISEGILIKKIGSDQL